MVRRGAIGGAAVAAGVLTLAAAFAIPYRALDDDPHPPVARLLGELDGAGRLNRVVEPDGSTSWASVTTQRLPDLLLTDIDDAAVTSVLRRTGGDRDRFSETGDLPGVALYRDEVVTRRADGTTRQASLGLVDDDGYALVAFVDPDGSAQVFDPPIPLLPADPGEGTSWSAEGDLGSGSYRYDAEVTGAGPEEVLGARRVCIVVAAELVLDQGGGPVTMGSEEHWCEGLGSAGYWQDDPGGRRTAELVAADGAVPEAVPPIAWEVADAVRPTLGDEPWVRTSVVSPVTGIVTPSPSLLPAVVEGDDPLLLVGTEASPTLQAVRAAPGDGASRAWTAATGSVSYGSPLVDQGSGRAFVGSVEGEVRALTVDGLFLWSTDVGDNVATRPVLADGTLVVGSEDGDIVGLDPDGGEVRWRTSTGGPVVSWPVATGGLVVIGSDDGVVRALDPADGSVRWTFEVGGGIEAPITAVEGGFLVADRSGQVTRLTGTGREVWTSAPGGTLRTEVTTLEDGQAALVAGGDVVSLDLATGAERWRRHGDFVGPVAQIGGRAALVAAGADGGVVALDGAGAVVERWAPVAGPTGGDGMDIGLVTGAGAVWLVDDGGQVSRLGPATAGQAAERPLQWLAAVGMPPFGYEMLQTSPLVDGPDTYLIDGAGVLYQVDVAAGAIERTGQIDTPDLNVSVGAVAEDGRGYVVASGRLISFALPSGEVAWEVPLPGHSLRPPVLAGGLVLAATGGDPTHHLSAVDADTGELRWQVDAGEAPSPGAMTSPLVVAGDLVVGGEPLSAWRLEDGQRAWTTSVVDVLGAASVLPSGEVVVAVTDQAPEDATGTVLVVVDPTTGEERSRTFVEGILVEGMTDLQVAGDVVVAQHADRTRLVGVDLSEATGSVWDVALPARRLGVSRLLDDGLLWSVLLDGRVVAIDPSDGTTVARTPELGIDLSDAAYVQGPVLRDGVVVAAGGMLAIGVGGGAP